MSSQHQPNDPPRLALRVRVSVHGQLGESGYEQAYQEVAQAHRIYGWDMPYVNAGVEDRG